MAGSTKAISIRSLKILRGTSTSKGGSSIDHNWIFATYAIMVC